MMRRKTVAICPKSSLAIAVISNTCLFLDLCPVSRKAVHKGHQDVGQKFVYAATLARVEITPVQNLTKRQ